MTEAVTVALIVATGPVVTGVISIIQTRVANRKLDQVHGLVNSRLSLALDEIKTLKSVIAAQTSQSEKT